MVAATGVASAATNGVVRGSLVNRATGKTYPGVTVTLEWQAGGKPVQQQATTDASGSYVFSGLPVDDTTSMTLSATVDGRSLRKEGVALSTWTPEVVADLEVVEASGDASKVHVGRLTTIFTLSEASEVVPVIEFWEIHNDAETPFAQTDASGRSVGFVIHLPEGAMNVQIEGDQTPGEVAGTTVTLTQPLQPQSTFVSLSYAVRKGDRLALRRNVAFPIEEALVLVGGGAWVVMSKEFTKGEPADIHGAKYETFTRHQIDKGATLELTLKKGKGESAASDGGAGASTTVLIILVAVGSVAAGGLIGSWLVQARTTRTTETTQPKVAETPARKRSQTKPTPSPSISNESDPISSLSEDELEAAKQVYLTLIARLDEFHSDGEIPEAVYRQLRDDQKTALGRVLARLNA
jgi:hypothetical protein